MALRWEDREDCALARSIFGIDNPTVVEAMIVEWAVEHGFRDGRVDAVELSVGAGITMVQPDLSKVFVKVWPDDAATGQLRAQIDLQHEMAVRGFPAPRVLSPLTRLGAGWAVAMEYNRSGAATDVRIAGVRGHMALGLSRLIKEGTPLRDKVGLAEHPLPKRPDVWPKPHNVLFDFEKTKRGAEWIDAIAYDALDTMSRATSSFVVGHHDWSAKNMRVTTDGVAIVYDWDAVFFDREAFFVGSAAAHFPVTWELDVPHTPTTDEMRAFIREYEQARGVRLSQAERSEIEAAATYARAYKARCEHALDPEGLHWSGSSRESLDSCGTYFRMLST